MQKILNISAVLVIVLIIFSIFSMKHFSAKKAEIYGPSMMASSSQLLALDTGKILYIFDIEGNIVDRKAYQELGIPPEVAKMQLLDNTLYLAMSNNGSLYGCDLTSWQCRIVSGFDKIARSTFGFVVTEQYVYVTDTSKHSLKIFDKAGNLITDSRGTPVPLCYPNQLSLIDDELYIADTNNHRLATIDTSNQQEFKTDTVIAVVGNATDNFWDTLMSKRSLPSWCSPISDKLLEEKGNAYLERAFDFHEKLTPHAPDLAREGSIWPTAFEYDGNDKWWILAGNDNFTNGDVLIYQDGVAIKRINDSIKEFDPIDIENFQQEMLVSDFVSMQVLKFSESGNWMGEFGDLAFQRDMRNLKALKNRYGFYAKSSQNMIYILVFFVIVIALLDRIYRKEP